MLAPTDMLIDDSRTRESLAKIVFRLTTDPVVREDLMQEALVHLWLLEERRPGQRPSWYLQGCKFHLQNHLGAGRSIDSPKRNSGRVALSSDEEFDVPLPGADDDEAVLAQVSARDIFALLNGRLTGFERMILHLLAEGLGAREIAERLKVTHPTIIKYRRRIATQAIELGIPPLSALSASYN